MLAAVLSASVALAQGTKGLRINEVMVGNISNCVDDYGQRTAWIELYNSTYGTMKISSVYITNDRDNPTKYAVPRGDERTVIGPHQHVVFFADGKDGRGPFHTNFTLVPGQENWIGVYEADGKTLIDEVIIPATLPNDCSYALKEDGVRALDGTFDPSFWEVRTGIRDGKYATPGSSNLVVNVNSSVEKFRQHDKSGVVLTLMAMGIVFSALILLSICFFIFGRVNDRTQRRKKAAAIAPSTSASITEIKGDSGEEIAAIAMALYEHLNIHDREDTILTINKVKKAYSPWSSKIYSLRANPRR